MRNAFLCAAAVIFAFLIIWPVGEIAFDDDWSYAFTVKRLAETGHIIYNAWSSPTVIAQSYWGLLWVKIFGFSFTTLRFSTLPLAAGAAGFTYLIARRAGLAISACFFAALLLGFSPLFLPLAASFMTDVPGCFCMLAATYAFLQCADSTSRSSIFGWLIAAMIAAALGGSSRQVVWVVPLALLPYLAWLRLKDRVFVAAAILGWLLTLIAVLGIQHWFNKQPYALQEPSILHQYLAIFHRPGTVSSSLLRLLLTFGLVLLPATVCGLPRVCESKKIQMAAGSLAIVFIVLLITHRGYAKAIWMQNILSPYGAFTVSQIPLAKYQIIKTPIRYVLGIGVVMSIAGLLGIFMIEVSGTRPVVKRVVNYFLYPVENQITVQALMLVTLGYFALEITRCAMDVPYDRHLLPIIPFATIPLLLLFLNRCDASHRPVPISAWSLLLIYGIYAIASTQQVNALTRARAKAADELMAAHIPRGQFSAGFEFDYWTELEASGHINMKRIILPAHAYIEGAGQTPHVLPMYRVEGEPSAGTVPTDFPGVPYFSFLPPFHRALRIDRVVHPVANENFHQ